MLQKLNKSLTISENKKRFMEDVMNHKIKYYFKKMKLFINNFGHELLQG